MEYFPTFELEVLIDQFTWIPSPDQTALIPEIRWINARTVLPEPTTIGTTTLRRITPANPFAKNQYLIKRNVIAENYLSAKRTIFYETEQALDILSIVSQRGFKLLKINPPQPETSNGVQKKTSLRDKLIVWSNKQLNLVERFSVARERFELSSEAPEAPMLDHYTTGLRRNRILAHY